MAKSTWATQFRNSLQAEGDLGDGEEDYRLKDITGDGMLKPGDEDAELFRVGYNALAHTYVSKALRHVEWIIPAAETPIERPMLFALCVMAHEFAENIRYKKGGRVFGDLEDMPDVLTIEPQAQLGEYRVDFLLTYQTSLPDFATKKKLKDGTEIPGVRDVVTHLIVECDGHDYHDRSKEQASRDRERDRELKKLGYEVFRYTGADIWRDPVAHARECLEVLVQGAWK